MRLLPQWLLATGTAAAAELAAAPAAPTAAATGPFFNIVIPADPTPTETYAAQTLSSLLQAHVCPDATFPIQPVARDLGTTGAAATAASAHDAATGTTGLPSLFLGRATLPSAFVAAADDSNGGGDDLGEEGFALLATGGDYHVAGSASSRSDRGTLYGALQVLEALGVRFLTSDATANATACPWPATVAAAAAAAAGSGGGDADAAAAADATGTTFAMLPAKLSFVPPLEDRNVYGFDVAQHAPFAVALRSHLEPAVGAAMGGGPSYASPPGFVHTSDALVNRTALWDTHREWFWPRDNVATYGQLCWTNASLVAYVAQRALECLRADPSANIISISQNDNFLYCNDTAEQAVIAAEGSPMGPLLRAVNTVADSVAAEFPHVVVDTLACVRPLNHACWYQWSRPAPKLTKPRPNVVIRLCTIECNFGAPLTHASNAPFQHDMEAWAAVSNRTWIWTYATDFANYVMPWPDYSTVVPNLRYFLAHGVTGVFEEGNYGSYGGDMAPLKNYLQAKALFDPEGVDAAATTAEFLRLYYSPAAAAALQGYLDLWEAQVNRTGFYLGESVPVTSAYLTPAALLQSAALLGAAAAAVANETATADMYLPRVRTAMLPTLYTVLLRWNETRAYAASHGIAWPYESTTLAAAFDEFAATFNAAGATKLNERGFDLHWLQQQLNLTTPSEAAAAPGGPARRSAPRSAATPWPRHRRPRW